jgi:hypothetical protein
MGTLLLHNALSTRIMLDARQQGAHTLALVTIQWYFKHQNTVETSFFGSESCAMKTVIGDMIKGLHY